MMRAKPQILLVDDDEHLVSTLTDFLQFSGYDVIPAYNGDEAMDKLRASAPDLVVLDITMPKAGGVQFLRGLGAGTMEKKPPVLVFTARTNMEDFFKGLDVAGFLSKAATPELLLAEIRRILGAATAEGTTTRSRRGPARILIADDDPIAGEAIARVLRSAGLQVERVKTGPLALEQSIALHPDVIVVKRILSEMNGDRVAALLSEMPTVRNIPVVLYDGTVAADDVAARAGRPGVRAFVPSNEAEEILEAVQTVLRAPDGPPPPEPGADAERGGPTR